MKRFISLSIIILFSACAFSQAVKKSNTDVINAQLDTIKYNVAFIKLLVSDLKYKEVDKERYKIYPTQNMYTFLKSDTKTGMIDQIQWNLEKDKEFSVTLSDFDYSFGTSVANFELYPTQNIYQFIMLEKTTGTVYHVQWGTDPWKRWVKVIEKI